MLPAALLRKHGEAQSARQAPHLTADFRFLRPGDCRGPRAPPTHRVGRLVADRSLELPA